VQARPTARPATHTAEGWQGRVPLVAAPFVLQDQNMVFDPLYLVFLLPGLALSFWASRRVKSVFKRYDRVASASGLSGAQAARALLDRQGLSSVKVEEVGGFLSDHYDPRSKTLRLSNAVFRGRSLSALGVAAHEAGHAIQDAKNYGPLSFRSWVVKPAAIGSNLGFIVAGLGLFTNATGLIWLGIALFSLFVVFTLITLPVEFDASKRAVAALQSHGIVTAQEAPHARAVLNAAAMTYVAAAVGAILQLLYLLMRAGVFRSDD